MEAFEDFWPFYVSQHLNRVNRRLHAAGTASAVLLLAWAAAARRWEPLAAAPVVAYGLAWIGHFAFERNRPATFGHPLWSLVSDFRLFFLALSGRLAGELRRHGIDGRHGVDRQARHG